MLGLSLSSTNLFVYFVRAMVVLTTLPLHEYAHAWAAYRLGDDTAAVRGRMTLNPFVHLDPVGTLMIILAGFGWAKPVPVNPTRFRGDMRKGMAITGLAGPAANILLALVTLSLYKFLSVIAYVLVPALSKVLQVPINIFSIMTWVNISLAVFNLLPFPPLDGWKIAGALLPDRTYWKIAAYERQFAMALMVLVLMGLVSPIISALAGPVYSLLDYSTNWILWLFGVG
jgi:Zn-dependent protease